MKRVAIHLLAAACVAAAAAPAQGESSRAVEVVAEDGERIRLPNPARRIVSLSPAATQLLVAAGGGKALVGRTEYDDEPTALARAKSVGDSGQPDVRAILALAPDLVLTWPGGNPQHVLEALREKGVPMLAAHPKHLAAISPLLGRLGELTGNVTAAQAAQADFDANLRALTVQFGQRPPVRVFVQVGVSPLMTVNGDAFVNQLLRLCRAHNVFGDSPQATPIVDAKEVRAAKPQAVVLVLPHELSDARSRTELEAAMIPWQHGAPLAALDRKAVIALPFTQLMWPTPRALQGARELCSGLEPARGFQASP